MVFALLCKVVQANLLQVLTASEGSVLNHHLQVAVRIVAAAVGLPELHGLQVLAVGKGTAADGDVLVVVVRAHVVIDSQHAIVFLQVFGIGSLDGGVIHRSAIVGRCHQRSSV